MVIRETTDGNTVWTLATYEQVIEDLKNEKQFQVFKDALQQKQQLKEKQESQSKKQVYQQSLKDMQEVYDKIEKFNKEHKAPLGTEKYEYELYVYMKQNGLNVHLAEEYENGEFLKDFDYGLVTGTIYTSRDAGHKRMCEALAKGEQIPFDPKDATIYYVGPTPAKPGKVIGSAGPTTSGRMDAYAPTMMSVGARGMIGKGARLPEVVEAMKKYNGVYFGAIGGAGALLAKCIKKAELIAYEDLGAEALRKLYVEDMPLVVIIDSEGNNLYEDGRKAYLESK